MRPWLPGLFLAALSVVVAFPLGCGGGGRVTEKAKSSSIEATTSTQPPSGRSERARSKTSKSTGAAAAKKTQAKRELMRRERAFDRRATAVLGTPFDRLIARLPIRRAPLYVEQYITTQGSHTLYTAVAKQRFCGMSAQQRVAAVKAFYRAASNAFRSAGINDFVQIVTPQAATTEKLPALAVAKGGSVSLTKLGGARGRC